MQFTVKNMTCSACSKMISMILMKLAGVQRVSVDEHTGLVTVASVEPVPVDLVRVKLAERGYMVSE